MSTVKRGSILAYMEEQSKMVKKQSKMESMLEASASTAAGFVTSFIVWQFIAAPLFGYEVTLMDNFWLTTIFTEVSLARQYVFRRFFNANIHKAIHEFVVSLGAK
jgi:hypothetical protein